MSDLDLCAEGMGQSNFGCSTIAHALSRKDQSVLCTYRQCWETNAVGKLELDTANAKCRGSEICHIQSDLDRAPIRLSNERHGGRIGTS